MCIRDRWDFEKGCTNYPSNQTGADAIWARYQYYKKNADQDSLGILRSAIETYIDNDTVLTIQNSFWNCKYMYDIYQDIEISEDIRDGAKEVCMKGSFNPKYEENFSEDYDFTNIYSELALMQNSSIIDNRSNMSVDSELAYDMLIQSVYASDMIYKARFFRFTDMELSEGYLFKAKYYLHEVASTYDSEVKAGVYVPKSVEYMWGIALLDMYDYTSNIDYLNVGSSFLSDINVSGSGLSGKIYRLLYYDKLNEVYDYPHISQEVDLIFDNVFEENYDYYTYSVSHDNDGAFIDLNDGGFVKDLRLNNLIVGKYFEIKG